MDADNPYAAPLADLTAPRDPDEIGVSRDGDRLVMSMGAMLPRRCLQCNEPTGDWRFVQVDSKRSIRIPLCPACRRRRAPWLYATMALGLAGCLLILASVRLAKRWYRQGPMTYETSLALVLTLVLGLALVIAAIVVAVIDERRNVSARKRRHHVWLKNVSTAFLEALPHWSGASTPAGPHPGQAEPISP